MNINDYVFDDEGNYVKCTVTGCRKRAIKKYYYRIGNHIEYYCEQHGLEIKKMFDSNKNYYGGKKKY